MINLKTCLKWSRGSPVKHCRKMADASKDINRDKRINGLIAVCVHNLSLVILLILSPLRNEIENENKSNQSK